MTLLAYAGARISLASPLVAESPTAAPGTDGLRASAMVAQWDRILADLRRLRQLEDDWDGQGARALDPANADRALTWVEDMRRWQGALPPTHVFPGTLGEVVLEWRGDAFHLAAEVSTPSQVDWLLNVPGQPIKQWQTDFRCPWIVCGERE